jgi:16S rRNA (cytidine1402-2'-O)-methyltransferase
LVEYFPERYVVVCRELTKKFEETWRGYPAVLKKDLPEKTIKGEFVVVIASRDWKNK